MLLKIKALEYKKKNMIKLSGFSAVFCFQKLHSYLTGQDFFLFVSCEKM